MHDGTIYLDQPGNIVQALDGRSGDLIWENRAGPERQGGPMRNLAIYQDKIYVATTDARLVALDARTGKLAWDVPIAPRGSGYSNTSGPIVTNGKVLVGLGGCIGSAPTAAISARSTPRPAPVVEIRHGGEAGQPGGDTWGKMPRCFRGVGRRGSPAATIRTWI